MRDAAMNRDRARSWTAVSGHCIFTLGIYMDIVWCVLLICTKYLHTACTSFFHLHVTFILERISFLYILHIQCALYRCSTCFLSSKIKLNVNVNLNHFLYCFMYAFSLLQMYTVLQWARERSGWKGGGLENVIKI